VKRQNKQYLYHSVREIIFVGCLLLFFFPKICQSSPASLTIVINPQGINFTIDGPPQKYFANKIVSIAVSSSSSHWVLQCQGTDLELISPEEGNIPAKRLFVATVSPGQKKSPLRKDFESLDKIVAVARGGCLGPTPQPVVDLYFVLESRWEDKPGEYRGKIIFTYIVNP